MDENARRVAAMSAEQLQRAREEIEEKMGEWGHRGREGGGWLG